jgi:acyl-CoA reductase-like NAD-dependent aldehyde dehydrogenase
VIVSQPYQVVQAYDRALIEEIPADDAAALEARLEAAFRLMKDRDGALKPYQRSAILIRAAVLLGERLDTFARLIAQEGGKPLTDARIEAIRAVDGLRNAAVAALGHGRCLSGHVPSSLIRNELRMENGWACRGRSGVRAEETAWGPSRARPHRTFG